MSSAEERTRVLMDLFQKLDPATVDYEDDELFREVISAVLENNVMTVAEFADTFSMSRSSVSRWADGRNDPHPAMRPVIYRVFRERISAIVG